MKEDKVTESGLCKDTFNYERYRYHSKGYGLVMAFVLCVSFFIFTPKLLLFFYSDNISNEGSYEFWSTIIINIVFFDLINLGYGLIYYIKHPFFEKYKITTDPWPWDDKSVNWPEMWKSTCKTLFVNHYIALPILSLESILFGQCKYRTAYDELPNHFEMIIHIIFFMFMDDLTFYWSHRFLHWDTIYPYIHKKHHLYVNPVSFSNSYAHPIEYMFGNVVTAFSGPLLLGKKTHLFTIWLWTIWRLYETADGHCGYEFSWSPFRLLPFSGSAEFHHYHHLTFKGNYGSFFTLWDRFFGTVAKSYIQFTKNKELLLEGTEVSEPNKQKSN